MIRRPTNARWLSLGHTRMVPSCPGLTGASILHAPPKNVDGGQAGHQGVLGPGSAAHHFVLRRARETRSLSKKLRSFLDLEVLQLPSASPRLPDAPSGYRELLADSSRVWSVHADAEAHAPRRFFARVSEASTRVWSREDCSGSPRRWAGSALVLDEIAEVGASRRHRVSSDSALWRS